MKNKSQNPFIKKFEIELKKVKSQEYLVQNEIIQIEAYTTSKNIKTKKDRFGFNDKTNSVFDLSIYGSKDLINRFYFDFLLNGENDNRSFDSQHTNKIYTLAVQFAKYYQWLKELTVKPNSTPNKSNLNLEQKLLALQFLGLELRDYNKTHSAIVLGQILNVGPENIRKNLSNLYGGKNNIRTVENLKKLSELFEYETFESISNKLKREIKANK